MSSLDCFFCLKTYECFPSFDDVVFDLSLRKITNNTVLQVLNTQLTETILKFQITLRSKSSVLVFVERSIINRAHLAKQLLRLVATGYDVKLADEVQTYPVPSIDEISPSPFVVKQLRFIEKTTCSNVLLREYYFRRVRILKQIGVFTSLMLTTLVPTIAPEQLHQFVTIGEIHHLENMQINTEEEKTQTVQD